MTNYLALNIGRNIDNVPMGDTAWKAFQAGAESALEFSAIRTNGKPSTILASGVHTGNGEWDNTREESAVVWLVTAETLDSFAPTLLRERVKRLARTYRQDAIAVIVGDSTLVESN